MDEQKIIDDAAKFVAPFEGFVNKPYTCPGGLLTFGFGSLVKNYPDAKFPMRKVEALDYLRLDLRKAFKFVERSVIVKLSHNQAVALVSFTHNLGPTNLRNSTLCRLLNEGAYEEASAQFVRWVRGGGKILPGLVKRREAERLLFLKPDEKPHATAKPK